MYYGYYNQCAKYRCGVCGRETTNFRGILQCEKCLLPLCEQCNHYGLCEKDFNMLESQDQVEVQQIYTRSKEYTQRKTVLLILMIVLIAPIVVGISV
jgi:ribosome-binding protein aMBF1 (putative translation factor)